MLSECERQFFKREFSILPVQTTKWKSEQIIRFATLLKVQKPLHDIISFASIHNSQFFNIQYLEEKVENNLKPESYLPYNKLKTAIEYLNGKYDDEDKNSGGYGFKTANQEDLELSIAGEKVLAVKQAVDKLPQIQIIELSCNQLVGMLEDCDMASQAVFIRKFNLDGFILVCLLASDSIIKDMRNIFSCQEIEQFMKLGILFIGQHFRQIRAQSSWGALQEMEESGLTQIFDKPSGKKFGEEGEKEFIIGSVGSLDIGLEDRFAESVIGNSLIGDPITPKDESEDPEIETEGSSKRIETKQSQLGQGYNFHSSMAVSDYGESEIGISEMGMSEMGMSEIGISEMGMSEMGMSEIGRSEYATSQRGSFINGQYFGCETGLRESVDCRMSFNVVRSSFLYEEQVLNQMKQMSMNLPFNLLNLQPLQQIKIRATASPFSRELGKEHWLFKIQGVKFGREKENELSFPDELSISHKHAHILFDNDQFYLQDVGSRTGTFLRINKCLQIEDETCIQLSPDIEIVFYIIKRTKKQGVIKAQIKRPDNYPDYKMSLKEGYKIEIGKAEKCHIRFNNSSLAEKHAEIYYKEGNFVLKAYHCRLGMWRRLSPKSVKSDPFKFKLKKGDIFRLSSKKSFMVEDILNELQKSTISE